MKSGTCPKCGFSEVYKSPESRFGENSRLDVSLMKIFSIDHYVCSQCNYLEAYVREFEDMDKLTKKWEKV